MKNPKITVAKIDLIKDEHGDYRFRGPLCIVPEIDSLKVYEESNGHALVRLLGAIYEHGISEGRRQLANDIRKARIFLDNPQ